MQSIATTAAHLLGSRRARRGLQSAAIVVVLIFFSLALYRLAPDLLAYDWEVHPGYLALALGLLLVRGVIVVWGWRAILSRLGYTLTWRQSFRLVSHSNLASFVPGGLWHAVGRVYLAEKEGVPRMLTAISMGIETVLVVLGAFVLASLSLFAWHEVPAWSALIVLAFLVFFVIRPDLVFKVFNWLLVRLGRKAIDVRLSARDMFLLMVPYLLNWALFGVMSFALVAALYPRLPVEDMPEVGGFFTASWLAGYLAVFVPQGLVVREFFITSLLTGLLAVPVAAAAAASVLSRAWTMLGIAFWAAISTRL